MEITNEEKKKGLNDPLSWQKSGTKLTSVNVNLDLWHSAKQDGISLKKALEFGIKFLLADKIGFDYPESNLSNKIQSITNKLQAKCHECEALREQIRKEEDESKYHYAGTNYDQGGKQ